MLCIYVYVWGQKTIRCEYHWPRVNRLLTAAGQWAWTHPKTSWEPAEDQRRPRSLSHELPWEAFWQFSGQTVVESAVLVAGLRSSCRVRNWTWRSWAAVVARGVRPLWTYSQILGNYFRDGLRWHKSSALADVPAGSVPFGHSQCDKTAPFRAAFYCGESKAHLRVFEVNGSS